MGNGTGACVCSHGIASHGIGTRAGSPVRTACSAADGTPCTPCGCRMFTPRGPVGHVEEIRAAAELIRGRPWAADVDLAIAGWLDSAAKREAAYLACEPAADCVPPTPGDEAHAALTVARAYLGTVLGATEDNRG